MTGLGAFCAALNLLHRCGAQDPQMYIYYSIEINLRKCYNADNKSIEEENMDIQYLLFLQNLREATGGVFDEFFNALSKFAVDILPFLPYVVFWCVSNCSYLKSPYTSTQIL